MDLPHRPDQIILLSELEDTLGDLYGIRDAVVVELRTKSSLRGRLLYYLGVRLLNVVEIVQP